MMTSQVTRFSRAQQHETRKLMAASNLDDVDLLGNFCSTFTFFLQSSLGNRELPITFNFLFYLISLESIG